jgi:Mrp family chromosome partitioning ATPase
MTVARPPMQNFGVGQDGAVTGLIAQILRRRRLFITVFVLALLPALAAIFFWPPLYSANGTVIIGNQEPTTSGASAAWIEKLGDPADLESQLFIIQSRRMLRLSLARPGVKEAIQQECRYRNTHRILPGKAVNCAKLESDGQELLDWVEARYSVVGAGRSRIISIGYRSPLPEVAFILANALLVTYLEDQRGENASSRATAATWLLDEAKTPKNANGKQADSSAQIAPGNELRQSFYQDLYNKASALEAERRILVSSGRLVSLAEIPQVPYFPKPLPLLAAGLTVAAALATLAALRKDINDPSVRRMRELEAVTMEPILATFPRCRHPGRLFNDRKRQIGEIVNPARALLGRLLADDPSKRRCILVASVMRWEGKSVTAMALARAAVETGRRILLIDCDLRSAPRSPRAGGLGGKGLAAVLRGEIEPQQAVTQTAITGIDTIQAGIFQGCPTMLLADSDFSKLMRWSESYDLVLIDSSAGSLVDIRALSRQADGVLWCVQWGSVPQSDVKYALDELRKQRVKVLGLVFTMVDLPELKYFERPRLAEAAQWGIA